MNKRLLIPFLSSPSHNRKSKTCTEPCGRIQKLKWLALGAMLLALSFQVEAQPPKTVPRIGLLSAGTAQLPYIEAFREGLRDLGYVEGKNIVVDWRHAGGKVEQLPNLAAELSRLQVDVIVATRTPAIHAAAQATKTIPIVMAGSGDPVAEGVVASLARPGGNVTGLAMLGPELNGKRLELLKEAFPNRSRVAVLRGPETRSHILKDIETAAGSLRLELLPVIVGGAPELKREFETATKGRAQAILTLSQPFSTEHRTQILQLAAKSRLPAMYERNDFVEAGGLMSYGVNLTDLYRRAAIYVDKILKGAKPADLPVEQPKKFEFIINLKAAKQIGLTIPPNVLVRADRVIK